MVKMNQQDPCEAMSFKGQMAARYKERMSMGFSLATASSAESRSHIRQGTSRAIDHSMAATDPRMKTSRNVNTGLPATVRSKSSLDDPQVNASKPTMKELITKFETRSFTSGQLKHNVDLEDDRQRIARDAWESSCHRIKMELDPTAMTSSSSSDVVDSKSSTSMSKPPHAQISRAALSLNGETHTSKQQIYQCFSQPLSETKVNTEKLTVEDCLNVTNSHNNSDCQISNIPNIPVDGLSNVEIATEASDHPDRFATQSPTAAIPPSKSEIHNSGISTPTRVNLRTAASRRKATPVNKYVVHKKDWGKGSQAGQKDAGGPVIVISNHETSDHNKTLTIDKDNGVKDSKTNSTLDMYKENTVKTKHRLTSPHSHTAVQKFDARSLSRQSEKLDDNKEKFTDDKQRTKAMERYLQFLKSSNPPTQNNASSDAKTVDKSKIHKALRPPTPHRILHLRRGSSSSSRNAFHSFRENTQSSFNHERAGQRDKMDTEARIEQFSRRGQKSKLISTDIKDANVDPSGGDFYVNAPISSSNSVDSSVYEYPINASPRSRIGQPKSETSDVKLIRPHQSNKSTSKWTSLSGRSNIAKTLHKIPHIRPHSARAHELSEKKQSKLIASTLRGRSVSASKTPVPVETMKMNSLFGASPKSITSVSSNPIDHLLENSSPNRYTSTDIKIRTLKCDSSDIGSLILTEDELADNDLVPVHLREKKSRDSSDHISVILSSSDDTYHGCSKTPISMKTVPQFKKMHTSSSEKHQTNITETVDVDEQQYLDKHETKQLNKHMKLNDEVKSAKNNPHVSPDGKRFSESNKLFVLHGKRRTTNTPIKLTDPTMDDSSNHKNLSMTHSKGSNVQFSSAAKVNKSVDVFYNMVKKESKDAKEIPEMPSHFVPDERRGYSIFKSGRERKVNEDLYNSEVTNSSRRMDIHQAAGEGHLDKSHAYVHSKQLDQPRESPTKKALRHSVAGHNSSVMKEYVKDKKGSGSSEPYMMHEQLMRDRDSQFVPDNAYNFFHFGHNQVKHEDTSDLDKNSTSPPQRKRRKAEQPKKHAKKKKKFDDSDDDVSGVIRPHVVPKTPSEKRSVKDKGKEKDKVTPCHVFNEFITPCLPHGTDEEHEKPHQTEVADKLVQPERRKSSGDLSCKSHLMSTKRHSETANTKSSGKPLSPTNSVSSAFSDSKASPKPIISSPVTEKLPPARKIFSPATSIVDNRPTLRMMYDISNKHQFRSQIPMLIISSATPRKKLDRLVMYRRWRESMLDCLRPSKLPLSESFRKTLDSAVMEEWAMHCWQPSRDMYVDSQGVWWSASYQEIEGGGVPEPILGDGRHFSIAGLLDLTARLPYMKVGPVRFIHATYILMAVACVTLGNMGIKLYYCGGDEYEYYCPDDDVDCLMDMFSQSSR